MTNKKGFWNVVLGKARKQEEDRREKELGMRKEVVMELFREKEGFTKLDIYRKAREMKPELYDSLSDVHSPEYERAVNDLHWEKRYLVKRGKAYWLSKEGRNYLGIKKEKKVKEEKPVSPLTDISDPIPSMIEVQA